MKAHLWGALLYCIALPGLLSAQVTNDYRTVSSGDWSSASVWERYNGVVWIGASIAPNKADGTLTIRAGDSINVSSKVEVDDVIIESGAVVFVSSEWKVYDQNGHDLTVYGRLRVPKNGKLKFIEDNGNSPNCYWYSGGGLWLETKAKVTIEEDAVLSFQAGSILAANEDVTLDIDSDAEIVMDSGSTYYHDWSTESGEIPEIEFLPGSALHFRRYTTASEDIEGLEDRNFGHIYWNCPNQQNKISLDGDLDYLANDFHIVSTGQGSLEIGDDDHTTHIHGVLRIDGGHVILVEDDEDYDLILHGGFEQNGGTLDLGNDDGDLALYCRGNFEVNAGTLTETGTGEYRITFDTSAAITYAFKGTASHSIHYTIASGATLNADTFAFLGSGTFTLSGGATLMSSHPNGIHSSGGTIQVSGTRTFSQDATYCYRPSGNQQAGNQLPSSVAGLIVENSGTLQLNGVVVTDSLVMRGGNIQVLSDTLVLGTSAASPGTLTYDGGSIIGPFQRWITSDTTDDFHYPVGTTLRYTPAWVRYSLAPTATGTITTWFNPSNPGTKGLPLTDDITVSRMLEEGFWTLKPGHGLDGGRYGVDLGMIGFSSIGDSALVRLVKREDSTYNWEALGNHRSFRYRDGLFTIRRADLSGFSDFGGGSGGSILPLSLLRFEANANSHSIRLEWSTAQEIQASHFAVERLHHGIFGLIGKMPAVYPSGGNYAFTDRSPLNGRNYYRLKMVDRDSSVAYSEIASAAYVTGSEFQVWPNPAGALVHIQSDGEAITRIQVLGTDGRPIADERFADSTSELVRLSTQGWPRQTPLILRIDTEHTSKGALISVQ